MLPLVSAGVVDLDDIVLDLKAATTGAGRSAKEHLLLSELYESVKSYSAGGTHRHLGEFDQELSKAAGRKIVSTSQASFDEDGSFHIVLENYADPGEDYEPSTSVLKGRRTGALPEPRPSADG